MAVKLKYNGVDYAPSLANVEFTTPYISRSKSPRYENEVQIDVDTWTLDGTFYVVDTTPRPVHFPDGRDDDGAKIPHAA